MRPGTRRNGHYLYSYTLASKLQLMYLTKRVMQTKLRGYGTRAMQELYIRFTCDKPMGPDS